MQRSVNLTISVLLLAGIWSSGLCQNNQDLLNNATLRVRVIEIKSGVGEIKVCLSNEKLSFLKDCLEHRSISLSGESTGYIDFEKIPFGNYAISVFQDMNLNNELDRKSIFKIPSEPFGFSNNPTLFMGPPGYDQCVFVVDKNLIEVEIALKQF